MKRIKKKLKNSQIVLFYYSAVLLGLIIILFSTIYTNKYLEKLKINTEEDFKDYYLKLVDSNYLIAKNDLFLDNFISNQLNYNSIKINLNGDNINWDLNNNVHFIRNSFLLAQEFSKINLKCKFQNNLYKDLCNHFSDFLDIYYKNDNNHRNIQNIKKDDEENIFIDNSFQYYSKEIIREIIEEEIDEKLDNKKIRAYLVILPIINYLFISDQKIEENKKDLNEQYKKVFLSVLSIKKSDFSLNTTLFFNYYYYEGLKKIFNMKDDLNKLIKDLKNTDKSHIKIDIYWIDEYLIFCSRNYLINIKLNPSLDGIYLKNCYFFNITKFINNIENINQEINKNKKSDVDINYLSNIIKNNAFLKDAFEQEDSNYYLVNSLNLLLAKKFENLGLDYDELEEFLLDLTKNSEKEKYLNYYSIKKTDFIKLLSSYYNIEKNNLDEKFLKGKINSLLLADKIWIITDNKEDNKKDSDKIKFIITIKSDKNKPPISLNINNIVYEEDLEKAYFKKEKALLFSKEIYKFKKYSISKEKYLIYRKNNYEIKDYLVLKNSR